MDLDLKPNSLKISLLLLFILLFFLYVKPVYGDGGFVPTPNYREMHKYVSLPEQKSIIVWDGENEKMVLSSKVKAEDISNFAWILPIQSSIKPRVERGDIDDFYKLAYIFLRERGDYPASSKVGNVKVVEEKEVGPNDITILKANSTDSLIGWLNENGFKISKESSLVLDDYINSKNFYFIAGKINLENVEEFPEFKSMESKAEEIRNTINKNPELRPYIHPDFHYNLRKVSLDILLNKSWNEINQKFLKSLNISREKYNLIRKNYSVGRDRYGFTDKKTVNQLKKIGGSMEKGYKFEKCLFECVQITNNKVNPSYADYFIICYEPGRIKDERVYWRYELPEHWLRRSGGRDLNCSLVDARNFKQINFNKEGSVKTIYNYRNIVKEVSDIKITNLHNETNNTIRDVATSKYKEIEEKLMDFCGEEVYKESNVNEVCNPLFEEECIKKSMQTCINYSLRNGIGTPLKIVFQPENPYYPLKISSINKGETNIKIYVIAPKPVEDINNMLSFEKSYKLGKYGVKELKIDVPKNSSISYLSYKGNLSELKKDAVFQEKNIKTFENKPNSLTKKVNQIFKFISSFINRHILNIFL